MEKVGKQKKIWCVGTAKVRQPLRKRQSEGLKANQGLGRKKINNDRNNDE